MRSKRETAWSESNSSGRVWMPTFSEIPASIPVILRLTYLPVEVCNVRYKLVRALKIKATLSPMLAATHHVTSQTGRQLIYE